jgi:hypothetical protein
VASAKNSVLAVFLDASQTNKQIKEPLNINNALTNRISRSRHLRTHVATRPRASGHRHFHRVAVINFRPFESIKEKKNFRSTPNLRPPVFLAGIYQLIRFFGGNLPVNPVFLAGTDRLIWFSVPRCTRYDSIRCSSALSLPSSPESNWRPRLW